MISIEYHRAKGRGRDRFVTAECYVGDTAESAAFVGALATTAEQWQELSGMLMAGAAAYGSDTEDRDGDFSNAALSILEYVSGMRD